MILILGIFLLGGQEVEARKKRGPNIGKKIKNFFKGVGKGIKKAVKTVEHIGSSIVHDIVGGPPKHRSRFDKYPIYVIRYHQFIWRRFFKRYLNQADDGRPQLPHPKCWSILCWTQRNSFARYWKWRAPVPSDGDNSPPYLRRWCMIPGQDGGKCRDEHLRHDYYWRMFMWIGRFGFPAQPPSKTICITSYCRHQRRMYHRYWNNFWLYTSLVPVIRPYDYNWRFWFMRFGGNQMQLQQFVSSAYMTMGLGGQLNGGINMMAMVGGGHLTVEMKQVLYSVLQRNLAQTMNTAQAAQQALAQQQSALMMLIRMPAYPSAVSAQMQMQSMVGNMQYRQYMQQQQMQTMLQQQIWGMARYLRGSCGCGMCSNGGGMQGGYSSGGIPTGSSMYIRQNGIVSPIIPRSGISGINGFARSGSYTVPMPVNPVNDRMQLQMRAQALFVKNNLPGMA